MSYKSPFIKMDKLTVPTKIQPVSSLIVYNKEEEEDDDQYGLGFQNTLVGLKTIL